MAVLSLARIAAAMAAVICAPFAQAATLNSGTFSAVYLYPDASTTYGASTGTGVFAPGAGTDGVINVEGVTDIALDLDGKTITVDMATTLTNPVWNATPFNGFSITVLGGLPEFASFALTSSSFGPILTSFTGSTLFVNWSGVGYQNGDRATFAVAFADPAAVPLPAGLPLLAGGVAALALLRRRARTA